jgi:hypothetical protein
MSKYDELKRLASGMPAPWVTDADEPNIWHPKIRYSGDDGAFCGPIAELYSNLNLAASDPRMHLQMKQMAKFIAAANPAAILELIAENERLAATNEQITAALYDQIEITHQHRLESDGLKAERDQMRELLMRLVDLQNSGRGPIRSYELWNDVVNEARPLLGLEVRHV